MSSFISIVAPKKIRPLQMIKTAQHHFINYDTEIFKGLILPEIPPRSIDVLLRLISLDDVKAISLLEWIVIFEESELLNESSINETTSLKNKIWNCIEENLNLAQIALWRMCLYFDGDKSMMPHKLLINFENDIERLIQQYGKKASIVKAISQKNAEEIANFSLQMALKPSRLLFELGLPFKITVAKKATLSLEKVLFKKGLNKFQHKYIRILKSYSEINQDESVIRLINLANNQDIEKSPLLLDFISVNYGPSAINSRWKNLDLSTQHKLRELLGSICFLDFKKFIFQLTSPKLANALNLNATDIRQLQSRVAFWSNYQSRFHNFRVFLPFRTSQIIQSFGLSLSEYSIVDGFDNAKHETELCLLEFDRYIVVESGRDHTLLTVGNFFVSA